MVKYILVNYTIIKRLLYSFEITAGLQLSKQTFNSIYIKNYQYNSGSHEQCFLGFHTSVVIVVHYLVPYDEYEYDNLEKNYE